MLLTQVGAQPDPAQPDPGSAQPDPAQSDPGPAQPDLTQPDPAQPDPGFERELALQHTPAPPTHPSLLRPHNPAPPTHPCSTHTPLLHPHTPAPPNTPLLRPHTRILTHSCRFGQAACSSVLHSVLSDWVRSFRAQQCSCHAPSRHGCCRRLMELLPRRLPPTQTQPPCAPTSRKLTCRRSLLSCLVPSVAIQPTPTPPPGLETRAAVVCSPPSMLSLGLCSGVGRVDVPLANSRLCAVRSSLAVTYRTGAGSLPWGGVFEA